MDPLGWFLRWKEWIHHEINRVTIGVDKSTAKRWTEVEDCAEPLRELNAFSASINRIASELSDENISFMEWKAASQPES